MHNRSQRVQRINSKTVQSTITASFPALLRVVGRAAPLRELLQRAVESGVPVQFVPNLVAHMTTGTGEIEDASAVDGSLALANEAAPAPQPGTSYAGLSPAQRHAFLSWSRKPESQTPLAFQQLYLANLEARLFEVTYRQTALEKLLDLGGNATWRTNPALHRAFMLACWLRQAGEDLVEWNITRSLPTDLLGVALGQQALLGTPLTPAQLGEAITTWKLGTRPPDDLLKLRLDSLTAILGQPPLAYALSQAGEAAASPRPWRMAHRGLRLLIPQPDLRPILEPALRDLMVVADVQTESEPPVGALASLAPAETVATPEGETQPSLEELGWRLILEFGSNRSEYFDYVVAQAQKLAGYSQLMDEDRRIVYRIIFRKSEMRRFWRIWDYIHGWTSTRVYLNGVELEKWKVWPYSHYLH
jgi:hypothetical protein